MRKLIGLATISFFIGACGGGGGSGNGGNGGGVQPPPPLPAPTAFSGQFKDSNVQGLAFSTATQSGVTDETGTFSYLDGESIEFAVGGVVIGSATAGPIITPIDLVPGSSASDQTVANITRFLLMLDQDEDPIDGITISDPVQTAAGNWAQPDFSSATFDNDIVTIVSDVASMDDRAAALPTTQVAQAHLQSTERCLMSGLFSGQMTGPISGDIYILVYPNTGTIKASYPGTLVNYESGAPTAIDRQRSFRLPNANNPNDNFEGSFDSYNQLSGIWTVGNDNGTFTVTREMADRDAKFRYTGEWYTGVVRNQLQGLQVFNVDANGEFQGTGPQVVGNRYATNGTISGDSIVMTFPGSPTRLTGTVDSDLNAMLTGINSDNQTVISRAEGCRLN